MKKENAIDLLKSDILMLEQKQLEEMKDLKEHFQNTLESFKPINLIKNTIKDITQFPDIQGGLGKAAIGMSSGYLLKKLFFKSSINPLKIIAGMAFQTIVSNVAAKNSDIIKEKGIDIFEIVKSFFVPKKKESIQIETQD